MRLAVLGQFVGGAAVHLQQCALVGGDRAQRFQHARRAVDLLRHAEPASLLEHFGVPVFGVWLVHELGAPLVATLRAAQPVGLPDQVRVHRVKEVDADGVAHLVREHSLALQVGEVHPHYLEQ